MRKGRGDKQCMICQDEYGSKSNGNGKPERQVRLPCHGKHTVGSTCITKWLEDHNTCPMCRHEFFPAEDTDVDMEEDDFEEMELEDDEALEDGEEMELEDRIFEDGSRIHNGEFHPARCYCFNRNDPRYDYDSEDEEEQQDDTNQDLGYSYYRDWEEGQYALGELCYLICDARGFSTTDPVTELATDIATALWHTPNVQEDSPFSNFSIAAACVFAATNLCRRRAMRAIYQRKLIDKLTEVCPVSGESICAAYRMIYEEKDREDLYLCWDKERLPVPL